MSSSIARIHVNGVEVGSIPADTYHAMVQNVRRNRRLYLAWTIAATKACLRPVVRFYCALPSIVVGVLLLAAAAWPAAFTALVADLQAADPQTITAGLRHALAFICAVFIVGFPILALMRPGLVRFESPFDKALSRQIRRLLEVPTEGTMRVEIIER
ncbi:hypothetical protein [Metapseudomonas furukawaii]|uniref:hypothetical protein n=1 Tax=Metapseudomonas furukawaii TaxID=1149133 RepID=UPI0006840F9A|nr:hypothetical protein [Pseudomonas furukawaii]